MEYVILTGVPSELSNKVNEHLKNGWQLYGHPCTNAHVLAQAMIKHIPKQ